MKQSSSRPFLIALAGVVLAALALDAATAQTLFEKLVMPGPLSMAHEKFKESCHKCHTPFRRDTQSLLCLDCHKETDADRKAGRGFHSKNPLAKKSGCRHCHAEHKGRDADIVGLDPDTFDHLQTDFTLEGKHATAACSSCHNSKEAHRKAPSRCIDCHRAEDPHKSRLGENCYACHTAEAWRKPTTFDHSKTNFELVGSHRKVACRTCHAGEVYKGAPTSCSGCHALQDVHKGERGNRCESCHSSEKWMTVRFDHDKDTKFPLKGAHKTAKCETCHRGNVYGVKLATTCNGCHGSQDPHKGTLGKSCASCHNEAGWHAKVAFDHDLTRFPLIGLHAAVGCASCHRSKNFKDAPHRCSACHSDSYHAGRLGPDCGRCHSPNGWPRWTFDHAADTGYSLTGAHGTLDCHACHRQKTSGRVTAPQNCYACHSGDDAHHGAYGVTCESCHTTESFRRLKFRR